MKRKRTRNRMNAFLALSALLLVIILVLTVSISQKENNRDNNKSESSKPEDKVTAIISAPTEAAQDGILDSAENEATVTEGSEAETAEAANTEITQNTEKIETENTDFTEEDNQAGEGEVVIGDGKEPPGNSQEVKTKVEEIMSDMTLQEKVCQLFIVYPEAITNVATVTSAGETTKKAITKYPVGGILYESKNLVSGDQTRKMISNIQSYSKIPLFIASDEEGGTVARVMKSLGTTKINSMYTYKEEGVEQAYKNAYQIASDIADFGFNLDFAPVCDVWSNPDNKVIGQRAYSDDFIQAAELIPHAVKGFQEGGVLCTLKHFPGHGDTDQDSHYGSAFVSKGLKELREEEFLPFKAGIAAGADMVMTGHLILKEVDDLPATLSYKITTEILREELGFDGVIVTDSLLMEALTKYYSSSEVVVKAFAAGADLLLCPKNLDSAIAAILDAVSNGEISEDYLNASVRRILALKVETGIIK